MCLKNNGGNFEHFSRKTNLQIEIICYKVKIKKFQMYKKHPLNTSVPCFVGKIKKIKLFLNQ